MNYVVKIALLFVALCFPHTGMAQHISTGVTVICDTQDQLKRYAELYTKGDLSQVVAEKVNIEVGNKTACGVAHIAFVLGDKHDQLRTVDGPYTVTEVVVVGVNMGHGWQHIQPFIQFTLLKVSEEGV